MTDQEALNMLGEAAEHFGWELMAYAPDEDVEGFFLGEPWFIIEVDTALNEQDGIKAWRWYIPPPEKKI